MVPVATKKLPRPEVINPRSLTPEERPWLEVWSLDTQEFLVDALVTKLDVSLTKAWGIAGYLSSRAQGKPAAILPNPTKADYRKVLRALAAAGTPSPPSRRTPIMPVRPLFRKAAA
jgi:hypothetical protein